MPELFSGFNFCNLFNSDRTQKILISQYFSLPFFKDNSFADDNNHNNGDDDDDDDDDDGLTD